MSGRAIAASGPAAHAAPAPGVATPSLGLLVDGLSHRFGRRLVVDGVSLAVPEGAVHCLVGPSGCGKTTTLRLVAGLERRQAGTVRIGGRLVSGPGVEIPPERRRVGLMFQDMALFPHLTVAENVAFGLAGQPRAARRARVDELLARVELSPHARAYPYMLSGGEQQRVALARALAPRPGLVLLDEAFSALDATLRDAVRSDTLAVLRETGTPVLLVTHDAEEAVSVGDRIHIMQHGSIVQAGTPKELYAGPASAFVAGFFGRVNRLEGAVRGGQVRSAFGAIPAPGLEEAAAAEIVVRPEGVRFAPPAVEPGGHSLPEARGRVILSRDLGPFRDVTLELADGTRLAARLHGRDAPAAGVEVAIHLDPSHVFVYPATARAPMPAPEASRARRS